MNFNSGKVYIMINYEVISVSIVETEYEQLFKKKIIPLMYFFLVMLGEVLRDTKKQKNYFLN